MDHPKPLPRRAVLVVNAQSRKGQAQYRKARDLLERAGVSLIAAHAIDDPGALRPTIRRALADGAPMIIVGGGDGSLSSSVDDFVGYDAVFALLPLGTANSFARSLGIPLDLEGAVGVIAGGQRRRIDLGMIDHDYFANCAAIGLSPLIAQTVPNGLKRVLGRVGYLAWAAYQLTRFRPFRLTVGEGDAAVTIDAVEVRIANGPYQGGTELVEKADVESGEIVVQAVVGDSRHRLLWSWIASALKLRSRRRTTRDFRARVLRVATEPPLPISIDGEVLARTPVTASIARGVIDVAAPR
ncbi:MAG: diacylglycerol kinase [Sphingomonas sp. SCN 67-18]|uniref:diacylglycerol/lipid kinase family protein n=1 Tax=uncultured Sphingomonas sp. TaxID=158754 RepID=UPI00086F972E|nr:diacylglycerol kinase family protein [Sphingomonas sp. SCN 67-18]ODU21024.1 MAG: diacylglycerol kinase [Sphingomonas sp. SCN 67-18]